nr:plasmid mobilization relaxosome protein MobC [Pasteurella multocida]
MATAGANCCRSKRSSALALGVNLNQIARQCNSQRPSIDLVSVLATLREIEKNLKKLRELSL